MSLIISTKKRYKKIKQKYLTKKFLKNNYVNITGAHQDKITFEVNGKDNHIEIDTDGLSPNANIKIHLYGNKNKIIIKKGFKLESYFDITMGQSNKDEFITGSELIINENCDIKEFLYMTLKSNTYCHIEKEHSFKDGLTVSNTDARIVMDNKTCEPFTTVKGITIGEKEHTDSVKTEKIKSEKPILTIIVPTYNQENTLRNTLDSILKQDTKYPFIVKILEDCSTDSTLNICKEYVEKYPHIFTLKAQPKNTRCIHINKAMETEIQTPYFCFIEGDDYYINDKWIEKAVSFLESHKDYNTYCGEVLYRHKDIALTTIQQRNNVYEDLGHDLSFDNYIYIHTSARMYRHIFDFKDLNSKLTLGDIYIWYLYLDKGKVYFDYELMSVYRINKCGVWTSLSPEEQENNVREVVYTASRLFNYRHAKAFFLAFPQTRKNKLIRQLLRYNLGLRYLNWEWEREQRRKRNKNANG